MQIRRNATRYARETGKSLPRGWERLQEYAGKPGYFIHFSDFNKLGLNPTNKYDTPTGFYAYLADRKIAEFANNRRYAIVFKATHQSRLLDLEAYDEESYRDDKGLLQAWAESTLGTSNFDDLASAAEASARVRSPAGMLWNLTRELADAALERREESGLGKSKAPNIWSGILHSVLGYDGVVDRCLSIIHPSEPCQAVFFNTSHYGLGENKLPALEFVEAIEQIGGFAGLSTRRRRFDHRKLGPNREYRGLSFKGVKFRYYDLSGCVFVDCDFSDADLTEANLSGANLSGANLQGANLQGANLQGANLTRAELSYVKMYKTKLTGANLSRANLQEAFIHEAELSEAELSEAELSEAALTRTDLTKANLQGANLTEASLSEANLTGANLTGANLTRAYLGDANLTGAELSGANLTRAYLGYANLTGALGIESAIGLSKI